METIIIISLVLLWVVVLFNLLLTIALVRRVIQYYSTFGKPKEMLSVGDLAPDFQLDTLDGRIVTQADCMGRRNLMVFIAPNCRACKEQMPKLQALYPKARKFGIELMVISLANVEVTREFADEYAFTAPLYAVPQETNSMAKDYKVTGTPQYYIIDEEMKIQAGDLFGYEWEKLTMKWESDSLESVRRE